MSLFERFSSVSRERKYSLFTETMRPTKNDIILDVGCGPGTFLENKYPYKKNIIALDINKKFLKEVKKKYPEIKTKHGSAVKLPFQDKSIDIIFSNAVIEHVGGAENYKQFAKEIQRVSKKWFITTPNKWFPFEPHFRVPCYQFVPKIIQRFLSRHIRVGRYPKGEWQDIHLLSTRQLCKLFSGSIVLKHKVTIYPETLIVYGGRL